MIVLTMKLFRSLLFKLSRLPPLSILPPPLLILPSSLSASSLLDLWTTRPTSSPVNKNIMVRPSLNIIHWNCRDARNKIPEIQSIATNAHIICLQETLITATNQLNIPGFKHVNLISRPPGICGLSIFIRDDFQFSIMDCSTFATPSVEVQGIRLHCPLNEPLYIFNLYHHPGSNTLFSFYRNVFGLSSLYKYIIFLGDFNAHHFDWHDSRVDSQGDSISRVCEALGDYERRIPDVPLLTQSRLFDH